MASSAIADLVEKGKEIMRMKEEGQFGHALQLADVLAMKHPDSPLPPSLIGAIHYDAAIRAREAAAGSEEEVADAAALAETHLRAAHHAIIQVNSVAPDNIDNHIALAGVLVELSMFREAETALRRAWDLEANPPVTTQGLHSRLGSSTRDAKDQSYERLTNRIVDHEIQKVSEVRNSHGGALNALKEARSLAKRFPVSVRARLFEALIELEYMNNLPRDLDRTKGLERLLQSANAIVETFPKSGVSASFRARLLFLLGRHDDAEAECNRALPLVDLKEDTILPASIRGDKSEFDDLLSKITTKRQMAGAGGRPCQKITVDDIATIFNVDQVSSKEEVSFPAGGHELSKSTSNIGDIAAICNVDKLSSKEKVYYPAGGHELSKSTRTVGTFYCSNTKGIHLLEFILMTLWCLRHFVAEVIEMESLCTNHNGPCISEIVQNIFSLWENNEDHKEQLRCLAYAIKRRLDDENFFEKLQDDFVSEITTTILNGLHVNDLCLHIRFVGGTFACNSCRSKKVNNICINCSSPSRKEPHSTIVVYWTNVRADPRSFREILNEYVGPVMTFAYNSGTAVYSLAAMICYLDGCCVDIVRADGCWIMYNEAGGVQKCLGSWEFMLEMCRKYRPSVLLYEVIK
ncbi:uncharacterized protein LOC100824268 isoform X1 [Brachypodium distachyon]|nr:uncharacterized protein LOC100824268 isoform X1 [Brachypodium distachyon]|eukprot:XP_014751714.1 uncharacterized protein LOC100824268 isoform X1 [Brachypodium distachyon]